MIFDLPADNQLRKDLLKIKINLEDLLDQLLEVHKKITTFCAAMNAEFLFTCCFHVLFKSVATISNLRIINADDDDVDDVVAEVIQEVGYRFKKDQL